MFAIGLNSGTVARLRHPFLPEGEMLAGVFWMPALLLGLFLIWKRRRLTAKRRVLLILMAAGTKPCAEAAVDSEIKKR